MTTRTERQPTGLGRGLSSLIPTRPAEASGAHEIPLSRIAPNPYQPRRHVDEQELSDLASSIREHGVLQPVIVTQSLEGYVLVAGERRVRAARLAGLERIPAVVRQLADRDQLELAIVENVQRADLDPIEEAHAYRQLIDEFGLSQEEVALRVGRARATVTNTLRLLELDPEVQAAIVDGRISEGHARALASLAREQQAAVLRTIVEQALSVRQTEELVRRKRAETPQEPERRPLGHDLQDLEAQLRGVLATKVGIVRTRRGGRLVIDFYSDEELDRLYSIITRGAGAPPAETAASSHPDREVAPNS